MLAFGCYDFGLVCDVSVILQQNYLLCISISMLNNELMVLDGCFALFGNKLIWGSLCTKWQGNDLHSQGKFKEALQKYSLVSLTFSFLVCLCLQKLKLLFWLLLYFSFSGKEKSVKHSCRERQEYLIGLFLEHDVMLLKNWTIRWLHKGR